MDRKEVVLRRSVRNKVEKLEFEREDGSWRAVLSRPGASQEKSPEEVIRKYPDTLEAWKDVARYISEGYKILYYVE